MLRRMSWQEYRDWQAYFSTEPFTWERQDWHAAQVVSAIYNSVRDRKKQARPYRVKDFLLKFDDGTPRRRTQTWQQQRDMMVAMARAFEQRAAQRAARAAGKDDGG